MERLDPASTVLLLVDVQEKLVTAMPPGALDRVVKNAIILLESAKLLGVRVLATEQYPKGLGATIPALASCLPSPALPKLTFDAVSDLAVARALADLDPRSVIVLGMESHVCVFQTARELVKRGHATYVVADAVSSRTDENRQIGLSLCERAGATITGTESIVFDWLQTAGTDVFRSVSKLLR